MTLDDIYWRVNGYLAVAGEPRGERELIAVCDRWSVGNGRSNWPVDRYVVWRVFLRDDGQVIASAGHYTPSLADALSNMDSRP